jgi:hypothetical protein
MYMMIENLRIFTGDNRKERCKKKQDNETETPENTACRFTFHRRGRLANIQPRQAGVASSKNGRTDAGTT